MRDAVTDLHQIVDLGAAPDASFLHAGAIDAGVGLDFDIIFNDDRLGLHDLVPVRGVIFGEAEAVGADDCAILQQHAVAQSAAFAHYGVCVGEEVVANLDVAIDHHVRQQHRIASNLYSRADYHIRTDVRPSPIRADVSTTAVGCTPGSYR